MQEFPDDVLSKFHTLYKVLSMPLGETCSEANDTLSIFLTNCLWSPRVLLWFCILGSTYILDWFI